jgi:hypothetical protein
LRRQVSNGESRDSPSFCASAQPVIGQARHLCNGIAGRASQIDLSARPAQEAGYKL